MKLLNPLTFAIILLGIIAVQAQTECNCDISITGSLQSGSNCFGGTVTGGYDISISGTHPEITVYIENPTITYNFECQDGTAVTFVINLPDQIYTIPANSNNWYPTSADQAGTVDIPNLCQGGMINDNGGATFSAIFQASTTAYDISVRFYYGTSSSGDWVSLPTVMPCYESTPSPPPPPPPTSRSPPPPPPTSRSPPPPPPTSRSPPPPPPTSRSPPPPPPTSPPPPPPTSPPPPPPTSPPPTSPPPTSPPPTSPPPTSPPPTSPPPTSPLPTSPLPTSPLPTSPLPTSPLPTSPLPTSPLPTSPPPTSPFTTLPGTTLPVSSPPLPSSTPPITTNQCNCSSSPPSDECLLVKDFQLIGECLQFKNKTSCVSPCAWCYGEVCVPRNLCCSCDDMPSAASILGPLFSLVITTVVGLTLVA